MSEGGAAAERGMALLDLGRPVEAERLFREALAGAPDDPDLLVSLGRALFHQDKYGAAREAVFQGLSRDPQNLDGLLILSACQACDGEYRFALLTIGRALQSAPDLPSLHRQEAAILIDADRPSEALASLANARSLDPGDSATAALTAVAFYALRRFDAAADAVAEALRLDPENPEAHRIQGLLALRRGGGKAAVEAHRTALRFDPTDPDYREGLATAIKSRNPLYGLLLRFGDWLDSLSQGKRWAILLAPIVINRLLEPVRDERWAQVVLGLAVLFVLLTWTLEPVMNAVLLFSSYSRNLLPRRAKLAAWAFLAYVAAALAAVTAGLVLDSAGALVLAMGLSLWAMSVGQVHLVTEARRLLAIRLQVAGGVLAVVAGAAAAVGQSVFNPFNVVLILSGIGMLWFTSLA